MIMFKKAFYNTIISTITGIEAKIPTISGLLIY